MKRNLLLTPLITVVLIILSYNAFAQWTNMPYYGGGAQQLIEHKNKVFASTSNGIIVSNDQGKQWTDLSIPFDVNFGQLFATSNDLFILRSNILNVSADAGNTWQNTSPSPGKGLINLFVFKDALIAGIFRGTNTEDIYYRYSAGAWTELFRVPAGETIFATDKYIYSYKDTVLFRSEDGIQFVAAPLPGLPQTPSVTAYTERLIKGNRMFIYNLEPQKIFTVTDFEPGWHETATVPDAYFRAIQLLYFDTVLYIQYFDTNFSFIHAKSYDHGSSWLAATQADLFNFEMNVAIKIGNEILAANNGGIYRTSNYGIDWQKSDIGIKRSNIDYVYDFGSSIGIYDHFSGLNISSDYGKTWTAVNNPKLVRPEPFYYAATDSGIFSFQWEHPYVSFDHGYTWEERNYDTSMNTIYACARFGKSAYIIATNNQGQQMIYQTTNGIEWSKHAMPIPIILNVSGMEFDETGMLYMEVFDSNADFIISSPDGGMSWKTDLKGIDPNIQPTMRIFGMYPCLGSMFIRVVDNFNLQEEQYYIKRNNQWERVDFSGLEPSTFASRSLVAQNGVLYINDVFANISYSVDSGYTWTQLSSSEMPSDISFASDLIATDSGVYVGTTGYGLWKHELMPLPTLGINHLTNQQDLYVFPNPCTDRIVVKLPNEFQSTLQIFDMQGKRVKNITLDNMQAAQSNISIDLQGIDEGAYLLMISDGRKVYKGKFIKL